MAMVEDIVVFMEQQEVECAQKYSNLTPPGTFPVNQYFMDVLKKLFTDVCDGSCRSLSTD